MKKPADILVDKFGSYQAVADALGVDVSRVYRWTYSDEGTIPSRHLSKILEIATERKIKITAKELINGSAA
jgi:hypothetical protein